MDLTGPANSFSSARSFEELFSLLYTAGFRLTGDHQEAASLVEGAVSMATGEDRPHAYLKMLCQEHVKRIEKARDKIISPLHVPSGFQAGREQLVQDALLCLPARERLVVVLRDVLGLNYAEIGKVADLDEPAVSRLLAAGRKILRDLLISRTTRSNYCSRWTGI